MARSRANTVLKIERRPKLELSITPRQQEILRMIALGHTNREISETLEISIRTVEVHRFNLMRRLNVRNVAQLLRQALRHGLLPRNFGLR